MATRTFRTILDNGNFNWWILGQPFFM